MTYQPATTTRRRTFRVAANGPVAMASGELRHPGSYIREVELSEPSLSGLLAGGWVAEVPSTAPELKRQEPGLVDPAIDAINGHSDPDANCCLISWRNTHITPVTVADVRRRAAEIIERRGWTPDVVKDRPEGPVNVYRALQQAARELEAPMLRMPALRELRIELRCRSIFEWEAGRRYVKRDGFEPELVDDGPRDQAMVLAALRADGENSMVLYRAPSGRLHWLRTCSASSRGSVRVRVAEPEWRARERCRCVPSVWAPGQEAR